MCRCAGLVRRSAELCRVQRELAERPAPLSSPRRAGEDHRSSGETDVMGSRLWGLGSARLRVRPGYARPARVARAEYRRGEQRRFRGEPRRNGGRCASLKGSPGRSGGDRAEFNAVELGRDFPTLAEQIVIGLKTKPEPIGQPLRIRARSRSVSAVIARLPRTISSMRRGDTPIARAPVLGQTHWLHEFEQQDLLGYCSGRSGRVAPADAARVPSSLCKASAARRKDNETADERGSAERTVRADNPMCVRCQQYAWIWDSRKGHENALAHEVRMTGLVVAQQ